MNFNEWPEGHQKMAIPRVDRKLPIPAAFSQRGLWFQYQLEGTNSTYNVTLVYHLSGELNIPALEKSLQYLIARHESLRMSIKVLDGEPYLEIPESVEWGLDIRRLDWDKVEQDVAEVAARPFLLEQAPLFRAHLWTGPDNKHTLLLNFHHIILDGWSSGIFKRELASVYASLVSGGEAALPALELDYADYAAWQHNWLKSEEFKQGLAYWKEVLQGAPELLELPTDHPRPAVQRYRGDKIELVLEPALMGGLQELSRREHITLFMVMNAAFAILLGRYSGQEDIVIGVPMANRLHQELEDVFGFFVNTLPLRVDLSSNPTLPELLQRMRQVALKAYDRQDVPLEKIMEEIRPRRDPGYHPIFQAVFDFINMPSHGFRLGDCEVQSGSIDINVSKFDLLLVINKKSRGFRIVLEYNTDLFERLTAERMLAHYTRILEWMVSAPAEGIHDLELLSNVEKQQILVDWNITTDYPRRKTIHQIFEEQVAASPNAPALVFSTRTLTYHELNVHANQLAHALCEMGVGPEVRVGIYMERSAEMIIALLAILKAGGAYVPLDPSYPPERISFILKDTTAQVLLTLKHHLHGLPAFDGKLICIDDETFYTRRSQENPVVPVLPENLAYIIYTSGSTGLPKGSCIPHRAVVRLVKDTNYIDFNSKEVFLQFAPLAFDASTFEIWGSLLNGAKLVVFPPYLPSLDELTRFVETSGVTTLWLTAGLFHQVMEWHPEIMNHLHQLLSGGDVLSPRHVRLGLEQNPKCRFVNGYGPTENTTFTCCYTVKELPDLERSLPIGCPIANTSVYILDNHRKLVPIGVVGEIYAGGDGLAREYLNQPELTQKKFVPDLFHAGAKNKLYQTGDYGRWLPDGNIEFIGRMDHQVKIRGFRVELAEIESVLMQHPAVRQALVVLREDQPGEKWLVGYVIPSTETILDLVELRDYLKGKLPGYMVPTAFVPMDKFPLTANGKFDRQALPLPGSEKGQEHYLAPGNLTERRLASIWEELLEVDRIGRRDNFFELGGNSLLAMRMLARIQKEIGQSVPLSLVFQDGTVEALAAYMKSKEKEPFHNGVVPIQPEGNEIPIFILGTGLGVRDLGIALGASHPTFRVYPHEDGQMVFRDSVEETAKIYYRCLTEFFPQGPYVLLAHCVLGYFALELGRLLSSNGKKVTYLGLLDTFPRPNSQIGRLINRQIDRLVDHIKFHLNNLRGKNLSAILEYAGLLVQHFVSRFKYDPVKASVIERKKREKRLREGELLNTIVLISRSYKPKRYDGRVNIFLATERDFDKDMKWMKRWARTFIGPNKIIPVPGNHLTMFEQPNVEILAKKILDSIHWDEGA